MGRERGAALVLALWFGALISVMAGSFAFSVRTEVRLASGAVDRARAGALAEAGVACDTSYANFVLARFASPEEAAACDAHLQGEGLIVRAVAGYKLPECLRITIGDEASCRRVAHAIRTFRETQS